MPKIKIEIETDNAAFQEGPPEYEVATVLRALANRLEDKGIPQILPIFDTNGNKCGIVTTER